MAYGKVFLTVSLIVFFFREGFGSEGNFRFLRSTPASQGMSLQKLDALRDILAGRRTKRFIIIRHDRIVYDWSAPDFGPGRLWHTASLAKALVGGMSLALALNDGLLAVDDLACKYIPEWKDHPQKSKITIRHLATHSSGIDNACEEGAPRDRLTGWKGGFWRREPDPFTIARDQAPIIFAPGSRFAYSNPGMAMLAYAVTAALKDTPYHDIRTLLRERVMEPIGVPANEWHVGYDRIYKVDGLNLVANWGGGRYTARTIARVGRLMLRKGNWQGKQLIGSVWVEKVVKYAATPLPDRAPGNPQPACGLGWYTNFDGAWPRVPRDAFAGAGSGNQVLLVAPSLDLIAVRLGQNLFDSSKGESCWGGLEKYLFNPLMDSIVEPPHPPSRAITGVQFAPLSSIIRQAKGCDGWPITWADDGNQYTAYADGWGFRPQAEKKLSLGIAKIVGSPPDFNGINIQSQSGERIGDGKEGAKASGMLMVGGVLYMLVRNTGNSQLAWSEDHGKTWSWSDWRFTTSFGYPIFLNFGKNYRGARDKFVYIYSHDCNSAYKPADRMILARVSRERIRRRNSYEFFKGFDTKGMPVWTMDIRERGGVFVHPARCRRSGISYNPHLRRYLWCQIIPAEDTRFKGGFGIYDAPEPWGPWTTVYFTREWDTGPGDVSTFPTKWMSDDGKECYLLFSGDDHFSVREARFTVTDTAPPKAAAGK